MAQGCAGWTLVGATYWRGHQRCWWGRLIGGGTSAVAVLWKLQVGAAVHAVQWLLCFLMMMLHDSGKVKAQDLLEARGRSELSATAACYPAVFVFEIVPNV